MHYFFSFALELIIYSLINSFTVMCYLETTLVQNKRLPSGPQDNKWPVAENQLLLWSHVDGGGHGMKSKEYRYSWDVSKCFMIRDDTIYLW